MYTAKLQACESEILHTWSPSLQKCYWTCKYTFDTWCTYTYPKSYTHIHIGSIIGFAYESLFMLRNLI